MCCCTSHKVSSKDSVLKEVPQGEYKEKARDARITAFVLGLLSLFFFAASFMLYGMGTLPPTALMGLGALPYLGGALLSYLGIGILCSSLIFALVAAVRHHQAVRHQVL